MAVLGNDSGNELPFAVLFLKLSRAALSDFIYLLQLTYGAIAHPHLETLTG
jgi:hypothetical protein